MAHRHGSIFYRTHTGRLGWEDREEGRLSKRHLGNDTQVLGGVGGKAWQSEANRASHARSALVQLHIQDRSSHLRAVEKGGREQGLRGHVHIWNYQRLPAHRS